MEGQNYSVQIHTGEIIRDCELLLFKNVIQMRLSEFVLSYSVSPLFFLFLPCFSFSFSFLFFLFFLFLSTLLNHSLSHHPFFSATNDSYFSHLLNFISHLLHNNSFSVYILPTKTIPFHPLNWCPRCTYMVSAYVHQLTALYVRIIYNI